MRRPRIFTVCRRVVRKGLPGDLVGEHHLDLIVRFGGVPVMIPRVAAIKERLGEYGPMDGLLLMEGEDIEPAGNGMDSERKEIEFKLAREALDRDVPYLGICRGSHILNVIRGGTLHADLATELNSTLKHEDNETYLAYRHPVRVAPRTPLAEWYGEGELWVNSFHHQGVKTLAPGLVPMAHSPDGLIEGFFDPAHPFRIGLQFHPERMQDDHPGSARVFKAFLEAAEGFANRG